MKLKVINRLFLFSCLFSKIGKATVLEILNVINLGASFREIFTTMQKNVLIFILLVCTIECLCQISDSNLKKKFQSPKFCI